MFKILIPFLFIISFTSVGQAADMVVIHSNVTQEFPEGRLLDSSTPINLASSAKVTVVFANGGVKTVNGPYQGRLIEPFSIHKSDPKLIATLAELLLDDQSQKVRSTRQPPEDIWLIDVSTSKRYYCIEPSRNVILWRPKRQSQGASDLLIKHKRTSTEIKAKWPARKMTLYWPNLLPIFYGDTYTIEISDRNHSAFKKLILYQLPRSLPTNSHKVVWMVSRGCIPQANLLLASLR